MHPNASLCTRLHLLNAVLPKYSPLTVSNYASSDAFPDRFPSSCVYNEATSIHYILSLQAFFRHLDWTV